MSTSPQVTFGPYFGFTLQELTKDNWDGNGTACELTRYKNARRQSHSRLTGSTINGQSFSFGKRDDGTLDEWQNDLQAAIAFLDPGLFPFDVPTNNSRVAFRA